MNHYTATFDARSLVQSFDSDLYLYFWFWRGRGVETEATKLPIVPAPDDRWVYSISWKENWLGNKKHSQWYHPPQILHDLSWDGTQEKPATNRLNYATAWTLIHEVSIRVLIQWTATWVLCDFQQFLREKFGHYIMHWCRNSLLLQSVKVHRSFQKRSPLKPNLTQLNPF